MHDCPGSEGVLPCTRPGKIHRYNKASTAPTTARNDRIKRKFTRSPTSTQREPHLAAGSRRHVVAAVAQILLLGGTRGERRLLSQELLVGSILARAGDHRHCSGDVRPSGHGSDIT